MPTRGNYMESKKNPGPPTGQLVDGSQPVKLDGLADAVKSATKALGAQTVVKRKCIDQISNRPQPTQPSINNQTDFLKKPNYSSRAGKMVKVLYGRDYSHYCLTRNNNITLLCTYFVTNKRDRRFPNRFKPNQNETSSDDFHSDKRKLCTPPIKNEQIKIQSNDKSSNKINAVLEGLGFVCNNDKVYTDSASQIHCYNVNKQYNTGYGTKTFTSPKSKIPVLQKPSKPSDSYYLKQNSQKSISLSDTFQQKNYYHKTYIPVLQKPLKPSESYCKKKENSQKFKLPSQTFQQKNNYHKNYNLHQNVITQKNTSSRKINHTFKKTHHFFQNQQIPIKYWAMRHMLFSKFDSGIQLDQESFYSVCPEVLSYHIAQRCENKIVCDPFCGAGGNIIQLAMICEKVIAVDIDPNKIRMARHNAEIYGVADKIEFIVGDIFLIYKKLKADIVFMSPPWGGPGYSLNKCYSIETMCSDHVGGGFRIFDIVKTIAPNIAFHMPKNTNILECVLLAKDFGKVEVQQNVINGKLNSLTAFFGDFYWNSN